MATSLPGKQERSGIRRNSQVALNIEIEKATRDGYDFYPTQNDVILTEGKMGFLPSSYVWKVCDVITGKEIDMAMYIEDQAYMTSVVGDAFDRHVPAGDFDAGETLANWMSSTIHTPTVELPAHLYTELFTDNADIIYVFSLDDPWYDPCVGQHNGDGTLLGTGVLSWILPDDDVPGNEDAGPPTKYLSSSSKSETHTSTIIISYATCPVLLTEQNKGRFGAYPTDKANKCIKRELKAILALVPVPNSPEAGASVPLIAIGLSIFDYCWAKLPVVTVTDIERHNVGVNDVVSEVLNEHFKDARLSFTVTTEVDVYTDDCGVTLLAGVAEHMTCAIDYAKCPLVVRNHDVEGRTGRIRKVFLSAEEHSAREFVPSTQYTYQKVASPQRDPLKLSKPIFTRQEIRWYGPKDEKWRQETDFLHKKGPGILFQDNGAKLPVICSVACRNMAIAVAISSALHLGQSICDDETEWRPHMLVCIWTSASGIKCRVFGKNPIDGCKPGFKS